MTRRTPTATTTAHGTPRQRAHHFFDVLALEVEHLAALRLTPDEIAARLGITRASIERAYQRHARPYPWKVTTS